jgi:hypothetical protein
MLAACGDQHEARWCMTRRSPQSTAILLTQPASLCAIICATTTQGPSMARFRWRLVTCPGIAVLATHPLSAQDRAHSFVAQASAAPARTCADVADSQSCHAHYGAACTTAAPPNYDAYLDYLKNVLSAPDSSASESQGVPAILADFQRFDAKSIRLKIGRERQVGFDEQFSLVPERR